MLTQQQIAQLLPFDKEKALKFPEFVYWKDGVKANGTCIGMIEDTKYTADHNYWSDRLALFPHRKVEFWLVEVDSPNNDVFAVQSKYLNNVCLLGQDSTDLNQSVTVLIFDETLLNENK